MRFLAVLLVAAPVHAGGAGAISVRGTAALTLTADGVSVSGEFPTTQCGGPFLLGEGMAWQTRAGDWQITVASENRQSGEVPLNLENGDVNVVVTANGPGRQFVRGPRNTGTLTVADDFLSADADLQLRHVVSRDTARLVVAFRCQDE